MTRVSVRDPQADQLIDWTLKGAPFQWRGLTASEAPAAEPLSLFDDAVALPVAVLNERIVRENSAWMRAFLAEAGVRFAPHGKTTMAPDLFRLQLEDGAWAITAATVHHARVYRAFGVNRIYLANQLVGEGAIRWVVEELNADPEFEFFCLVDSVEGVRSLARSCAGAKRPLQVLVEVGRTGGRAGVRNAEAGLAVARAVAAEPVLELVGVSTFEGVVQLGEGAVGGAGEMVQVTADLAVACDREDLFGAQVILSGGGSGFFDLVADILPKAQLSRPYEVVIRSGCYLTHDDGLYGALFEQMKQRSPAVAALGFGLKSALEVWGHVQSIPEPGRMICTLGKRDVGTDIQPPILKGWIRPGEREVRPAPAGVQAVALNDQHAYVDGEGVSQFQVGDLVGFGVSHPCTTFDKWRALLWVDDAYRLTGLVRTYF
jgi:D-serine dehydratase